MRPTIRSITDEMLGADASDMSAEVILIHKTKARSTDRMFRIVYVDTDGEVKKALIDNARDALGDVKKNAESITPFSDPAGDNSYATMALGVLPSLDALLGELKAQPGHHGSHRFDDLKEKGIACLALKSWNRRTFVFFNVGKNQLRPDKHIVSRLTGDGLILYREKLIIFEKHVFAVYYEDAEELLITSYKNAKKLFGLNKQFKDKCVDILDDKLKGLVSLERDDYEALLGSMKTNEKMVKMDGRGAFEVVRRETLEGWNRFHRRTPLEGTDQIRLDRDGKAVIDNRRDLEMLLSVLNNEIVEPVTERRSYALAPSKKSLQVSRRGAGPPPPPSRRTPEAGGA